MLHKSLRFSVWDKAFLAFVFLLPLVFNPWGFDMFEVNKNVFLRAGVSVLGLWVCMDFFSEKQLRVRQSIVYFSLAFVFILAIGFLSSDRPELSFWGTYYRQGGVLSFLNVFALFLLTLQFFRDFKKQKFEALMTSLTLSGLVIAAYAILQSFGLDIFPTVATDAFAGRSFSTLGNPTSLGTTLLFPLGAAFAKLQTSSRKEKYFFGLIIVALLIALALSKSRGALLGLGFVSVLYLIKFLHENKVRMLPLFFLLFLGGAIVLSTQATGLRSLFSRFTIWESSIPIVLESPFWGVGLENFAVYFEKTVLPDFFLYEDYDDLVDRPHNEWAEVQLNFGFIGSLAYIMAFVLLIRIFITSSSREKLWTSASLIALFVANQFGFSLITQSSLLFLYIAVLFYDSPSRLRQLRGNPKLYGCIGIVLLTLNFYHAVRLFLTDTQAKAVTEALYEGQLTESDFHLSQMVRYGSHYGEIFNFAYTVNIAAAKVTGLDTYLHSALAMNDAAKAILGDTLQQGLHDAALFELAGKNSEAEAAYAKLAGELAPNPLVYLNWADFNYAQADYLSAIRHYENFLNLLPSAWQDLEPFDSEDSRIFWKNHPDFIHVLQNLALSYEALHLDEELNSFLGNLK